MGGLTPATNAAAPIRHRLPEILPRIAREEVFGPVLSVLSYRSVDEAVALANDSDYGLAGRVRPGLGLVPGSPG